ncbi:MAG: hypothetical protein ACYTGC_15085, partial [Planctomycetota bacterium]
MRIDNPSLSSIGQWSPVQRARADAMVQFKARATGKTEPTRPATVADARPVEHGREVATTK